MFLSWTSFNNYRMLLMAFQPVVIFYLIWLINMSEHVRSDEGALLDLICWPDGNAVPVIITCCSVLAVISQLYGLHQLFQAGSSANNQKVTNGLVYYIWSLITMIVLFLTIIFYAGLQSSIIRARIKGGIRKAMFRYANHLPSKMAIDKLQTKFHCCGRVSYSEWFFIPWNNLDHTGDYAKLNHKFIADNVPFSCCSTTLVAPCIHHGVMQAGNIYKYNPEKALTIWTTGCEEKLIKEMSKVSWHFITVGGLIMIAMLIQVVGARYIQTAYRNGIYFRQKWKCEAYLLKPKQCIDDRSSSGLSSKRYAYKRTLAWVKRTNQSKSRQYASSSSTDMFSGDDLLKIDE